MSNPEMREVIPPFLLLAVLFLGGAYLGWIISDDIWLRGPLAFLLAFVGSGAWFVIMLGRGIWEDYKERQ